MLYAVVSFEKDGDSVVWSSSKNDKFRKVADHQRGLLAFQSDTTLYLETNYPSPKILTVMIRGYLRGFDARFPFAIWWHVRLKIDKTHIVVSIASWKNKFRAKKFKC